MPHKDPEARREYTRAYYAANREKQIAAAKAWNATHPEARRAGQRKWYETKGRAYRAANRERFNQSTKKWYVAHPEKVRANNRHQRLQRYGLTADGYEAMFAAQNALCALCGKPETHRARNGEVTRLAVDHDHVTGSIRALLCHSCNTGIGFFLDSPELLIAAADYLTRFRG